MTLRRSDGQSLVLFALVLVLLVGISALVVDVGLKYSTERRYQAIADAAALAGAQELQPANRSTPVTSAMQEAARVAALDAIRDELMPGVAATCTDWSSCELPGGQYTVSILTPSPVCVDCAPERAVQVTLTEPRHSNSFAGVFGQSTWALSRTSVAGLSFGKSYTIVALRPPQPNGSSGMYDVRDLRLTGGTNVYVHDGDVGSNSNMVYEDVSGNTRLHLTTGYRMYYFDPYNAPEWTPPAPADPPGSRIGTLIKDPGYVIPAAPTTVPGSLVTDEAAGSPCGLAAATLLADPGYAPYIPVSAATVPDMAKITCLAPGYFATDPFSGRYSSLSSDVVILLNDAAGHGLFWFGGGLKVQSSLIGGFVAGQPGVALVVPQAAELNVNTSGGGSRPTALMLNAGAAANGGAEASPAIDFAGTRIVTNTDPAIAMTLMVTRDPACVVSGGTPTLCDDRSNDAIKIAGQSRIYLAGVQFMPSDSSTINSSAATGYIGQIWTWTLKYSGGVSLTQQGVAAEGPGRIRIDTACSPGDATCR
ncbi:MAG TPA: pilus assembly protein TadG-related protein [Candidatus Limnocylindrales bacterium]|jgi:Flp pilus assembly protein TadG|nr:pilus assembly protein TadG-related protein [Candidatus Limnocylindrales bacterium]